MVNLVGMVEWWWR